MSPYRLRYELATPLAPVPVAAMLAAKPFRARRAKGSILVLPPPPTFAPTVVPSPSREAAQ